VRDVAGPEKPAASGSVTALLPFADSETTDAPPDSRVPHSSRTGKQEGCCSEAPYPLVRREQPGAWPRALRRCIAAACYFAWLGYVTAPLPLLLLRLPRLPRSARLLRHLYSATAWSLLVTGVRVILLIAATWMGTRGGDAAKVVCSALNLAHLVVVLAFALLLSSVFALEALLGRDLHIPIISGWAARKAFNAMRRQRD